MKKILVYLVVILAIQGCRDDDCPVAPDPCTEYPEKMEIIVSKESNQICNPRNIPLGGYDLYLIDTAHTISRFLFELNYDFDTLVSDKKSLKY